MGHCLDRATTPAGPVLVDGHLVACVAMGPYHRYMQMRRNVLAAAAILAGASGFSLVALGWWFQDWHYIDDWTDPTHWWGLLIRSVGGLLFTKLGLKVALAAIVAVVGLVAWMRTRRSRTAPDLEALSPTSTADPPTASQPPTT
jgi:NADH:ubiquinone oxidoreductase subunit 6 (subunit J)